MSNNALISVIVPYYNSSKTIKRSLYSVINQIHQRFEIIIVNDGSSDWDVAHSIIQNLDDKRITVVHHKENRNGSVARNTGVKKAKGKYIAFLDSDDEWKENHLRDCLLKILKSEQPTNCIVFSKLIVISGVVNYLTTKELPSIPYKYGERVSEYLYGKNQIIQTSSLFLTKKIAEKYLFKESLIRFQDIELILRAGYEGVEILYSQHIGVIVHWEENSIKKIKTKGADGDYSLGFLNEHKKYFSLRAYKMFIKRVVLPLYINNNELSKALKTYSKYLMFTDLSFIEYITLFIRIFIKNDSRMWLKARRLFMKKD